MPIDPRIAMGFQPTVQLESPLNRMAKFQQLESGQRANELAKMQMQEYQRGLQEQEGLRNYLAGVADINAPDVGAGALRFGQAGAGFAKTIAERAKEQAALKKTQAETKASEFKLQQEQFAHGIQSIGSARSGADVMAALDDGVKRGYFSQEQADAQKAEVAALQTMPEFQQWQQKKLQGLMSAKDQLEMSMPKPAAPPAMVAEYKFAKTPEGGGFVGSFQDFVTARAKASSPPAQQPAPSVTTIVDPDNPGRNITIDARQYKGGSIGSPGVIGVGKVSNAPAGKPMTQLQQQAQKKKMAADITSVRNAQNVVGELEKLTDELVGNPEKGIKPDPGLGGITGFQAMIPSFPESPVTSGKARKAQQKLETMKGKVMAFGRQLASLEGKLGNMAVQEWKFVSDSIQKIDPAAGNLDEQLRDIVRQAKNFSDIVKERYDLTYENADETPSSFPPPNEGGQIPLPTATGSRPTIQRLKSPLPPSSSGNVIDFGSLK